ncbi:MAG: ATP-binding protein [Bacilli bacterium]|nr:ATP-binding protein [Bacilli bacterium]
MINPFYYVNLTQSLLCLWFVLILTLIYLSKKNMNNVENRLYKKILFSTDLLLLLTAIMAITISDTSYYRFLLRMSFAITIAWIWYFMLYIMVITHEHSEKVSNFFKTNINLVSRLSLLLNLLCAILFSFLGIEEFKIENKVTIVVRGPLFSVYTILLLIITVIGVSLIVINRKKISKKKLVPFYLLLPIGLIAIVFMFAFPLLGTVQLLFTTVVFLMYNTIENPDIKMVNELTLAKDQAEKASNIKSEFLSSMSHELRTPLNAIVGLADISIDSNNIDEVHNDLQDIKSSSLKLLELVDGILLSNNIDNNSVEVVNSNYNFKELIDGIIHNTKVLIGDKDVQLKTMIDDTIPNTLYGDREKIKVILNNLLSNSVKYTDHGFIELNISSLVYKDKCNLRITVSDTGKGIKEEDMDKLYDRFYRSEENKDSDIEGTGLGLSITKSLVELLEGKITVNSTEGEGSSFTITLSQVIVDNSNDTEIL